MTLVVTMGDAVDGDAVVMTADATRPLLMARALDGVQHEVTSNRTTVHG